MRNAKMAGREGGGDSFQGILLSSVGVCTSHFFFSLFKLQLLLSLLKLKLLRNFGINP